jgi:hypothetical protein
MVREFVKEYLGQIHSIIKEEDLIPNKRGMENEV